MQSSKKSATSTHRPIDWSDVQLFLSLVKHGSLSHAATSMGLDVSTVSRRLVALEDQLGTRLFVRSRQGVRPTEAGEKLIPDARLVDEGVERLTRQARGLEVAPEGVVRLATPPTLGETFVIPRLERLFARYPKLNVELVTSTKVSDLTRGEADLAIRTVRPTSGDLIAVKLFSSPSVLAASRAVAARLGPLESLRDVPFITYVSEMSGVPAAMWGQAHARVARTVLRTNALDSQLAAARAGLGVAVLPAQLVARSRELVPCDLRGSLRKMTKRLPVDEVWLVAHQATREVPRVDVTWRFLRETSGAADA